MKFNSDNFKSFCHNLQNQLLRSLPGESAQLKMASRIRMEELGFNYDMSGAVKSAVLVFLYPQNGSIYTTFILRPDYKGVHAGQVSFPGGRVEQTDESIEHTALREAHEEVNIEPQSVNIIGKLSDLYIPPSNYLVTPVLGYATKRQDFIPQKEEVDKIIQADLSLIFDKNLQKSKIINVRGYEIEAPYFDINGYVVWGATAMILSELTEVIRSMNISYT